MFTLEYKTESGDIKTIKHIPLELLVKDVEGFIVNNNLTLLRIYNEKCFVDINKLL